MLNDLAHLIYHSQARQNLCLEDVMSILNQSIINNRLNDIHGLLIFDNGRFVQILEGPKQKIDALFQTIYDDTRHNHVEISYKKFTSKAFFSSWNMSLYIEGATTLSSQQLQMCDFLQQSNVRTILSGMPHEVQAILSRYSTFKQLEKPRA